MTDDKTKSDEAVSDGEDVLAGATKKEAEQIATAAKRRGQRSR